MHNLGGKYSYNTKKNQLYIGDSNYSVISYLFNLNNWCLKVKLICTIQGTGARVMNRKILQKILLVYNYLICSLCSNTDSNLLFCFSCAIMLLKYSF